MSSLINIGLLTRKTRGDKETYSLELSIPFAPRLSGTADKQTSDKGNIYFRLWANRQQIGALFVKTTQGGDEYFNGFVHVLGTGSDGKCRLVKLYLSAFQLKTKDENGNDRLDPDCWRVCAEGEE